MSKGRDRNRACPCGSGRKLKKCCGELPHWVGEREMVLPSGGRLRIGKVEASALLASPSPIPEQLLGLAQWSVGQALRPEADGTPTLLAIIMIVTAAEAVVNSLLEFVLPSREWNGTERKKNGFQWRSLEAKWIRLSHELKMKPELSAMSYPLKDFLEVVDIRHQLIHFRYGPNVRQCAVGVDTSYARGHLKIDVSAPEEDAPGIVLREAKLFEPLKPENASGYYAALENLLRPVLDAFPSDPFETVTRLKNVLEKKELLGE